MKKLDEDAEKMAADAMEQIAKQAQTKETSFNRWKCLECEGHPEFEHGEMMKHIRNVHNIPPSTPGTQRMTMHLDGRDWYQTNYVVEINGLKFENQVRSKRNRNTRIY